MAPRTVPQPRTTKSFSPPAPAKKAAQKAAAKKFGPAPNTGISISIITVVKNLVASGRAAQFASLCESVRRAREIAAGAGDYNALEHIVLDGASDDGSMELIAGFARKGYFAHYSSEKDSGIYNAMNKAASRARGAYIMFIHSDDEVLPEGLAAMQRALAAHCPDYCLAPVRLENPADKSGQKPALWRPSVVRAPLAQVSCHQGVAVSARAFKKVGGFDERYKIAADVDQLLRLYLESYAHLIFDEPVALFRAGGMSMNNSLGAAECVDICMRRYGAALGLTADEIKTLIQVNPAAWIFSEHRAAVASVVHKIARGQNAPLARAVYEAMLCAWFDDASGRSEASSSAGSIFDTPFSRARLLPRKRGIAYLLAAAAKKLRIYPLIRPLRNAIVHRAERRKK